MILRNLICDIYFSVMFGKHFRFRTLAEILLVISAALFAFPPIMASAACSVSFSAACVESVPNRLIEVSISASGNGRLSAALFNFDFDTALLEFREVKTPSGSQTESNASGGSIKISFLCSNGTDISRKAEIFSLVFMTVSQGSCDLTFTVSDCVDSDVRQMSTVECASGRITISEASGSKNNSSVRKTKSKSVSESADVESKASKAEKKISKKQGSKTESSGEIESLGKISEVTQSEPDLLTPIIVLCASGVICAAFIGFLIYKIISARKKSKNSVRE